MSLDSILQALEVEAERQLAEIEAKTQAELERIEAEAEAQAMAVHQEHIEAIQAPLRAEQARILNRAKLEELQTVMGTRESLLTEALEAAARRLAELPHTESYAPLLRQLTETAVETLGADGRPHLLVQSDDVSLMNGIVQEANLSATVEGGLERERSRWGNLGGVVVTTSEGNISLDNSLAARLQRAANLYRAQIAEIVFGHLGEG